MTKRLLRLLTELSSRKWVSRIAGNFANSGFSRKLIPTFAKTYKIKVEEAEKPLLEYRTLNDFFTRRLKPGMRPLTEGEQTLLSPVDALITGMGPIEEGLIFNVKGQDYTLDELLHRSPHRQKYKRGYCFVLYLSPTDYHRIHSPVKGTTVESEHVPGRVYPVNDFGLQHMPRVLSRNERLITYIRHASGEVAVVKVGALNVSSIRYTNDTVLPSYERGQDLAYFEFGSTVVLLTESGTFEPRSDLQLGAKVKMGEGLGQLYARPERQPKQQP
ncbi:archaetidylserine decarboxylase [Paenibacillus apiarius]|uniref:Phosphatidylserine decarboxylase proenzyme n=1 Tax=Paenibacillus apiarius TaxID=46240 RepID=A0ABT4DYA2_9BACL|nr:archaetidylserine decarboxylase [Paenibacillus apiarius]MCY9512587.1 archaetidylserine decarboxylase [Paenibacillus apiarius]MCY9522344.1 archaetidylserine decarboxylase [Paenibacillus apiarius]MCY9553692.1 archaetidylserine decarboxylase [Paenibacillus apiarius]MCY9556635.1 archaetidylserine decarboxylase [Paenibacillus apiarius]MCY9682828.1 archaetidylserine decarboxylase [Paenibacillus apiarius]